MIFLSYYNTTATTNTIEPPIDKRIKELRKERNLKQGESAEQMGMKVV
ncbi:MAG: hypothetical protein GY754_38475 [bacterium]|nr:hypothetical protein [bacterium]